MATAKTETKPYSTRINEATNDRDRDNTVTGDALIAKDAANESIKTYDAQPHAESHLGVLREDMVLPGNEHPDALREIVAHVVDADNAKASKRR